MALSGRRKHADHIGLLDIGSSKVVCAIAELSDVPASARTHVSRIVGLGHQRSRGIKAGVVVSIDDAQAAVAAAVAQAERMAQIRIDRVVATVNCGRIKSQRFKAHAELGPGGVTRDDIVRLHQGAVTYARRGGRTLVYWNRIGYSVDGSEVVKQPLGLNGRRLTGTFHIAAADEGPVLNLINVIERCYLTVEALVPAPIASGFAVTSDDERELGITVVDMGGGTTSFASFSGGEVVDCGVVPVGGNHVTFDIARRMSAPPKEAERIKALYGTMAVGPADAHTAIGYEATDPSVADQTTRADLHAVISDRVIRQLDTLAQRCSTAELPGGATTPVVLCGGAAQLPALAMTAAQRLARPVRHGRPASIAGLPKAANAAALAALTGLAFTLPDDGASETAAANSYLNRVQRWVRDTFEV